MKPLILVVDDCEVYLDLVADSLEDKFQVVTLNSAEACLEKINELKPDLIFLDIIMPVMDGYSICQHLKTSDDTAFIPVIFLSGLDQVSDRLEGYACGAEDYITKPFDESELIHKVEVALENARKQKMWAQKYEENRHQESVTRSAIDQLYEMGALMKFHQKCGQCSDSNALGNDIVETCHDLGLDATVQLSRGTEMQYIGCESESLEAKLLSKSYSSGYDLHVRNRSIFHGNSLSILIKNMPQDDEFRYGRFKDNLQMLVNSASNFLDAIGGGGSNSAAGSSGSVRDRHNLRVKKELNELLEVMSVKLKGLNTDAYAIEQLQSSVARCISQAQLIDNIG